METVEQLINALGGTVTVSCAIDAPPSTVSSWKRAGSIPHWRIPAIIKLAKKKGIPAPEFLSRRRVKGEAA